MLRFQGRAVRAEKNPEETEVDKVLVARGAAALIIFITSTMLYGRRKSGLPKAVLVKVAVLQALAWVLIVAFSFF